MIVHYSACSGQIDAQQTHRRHGHIYSEISAIAKEIAFSHRCITDAKKQFLHLLKRSRRFLPIFGIYLPRIDVDPSVLLSNSDLRSSGS